MIQINELTKTVTHSCPNFWHPLSSRQSPTYHHVVSTTKYVLLYYRDRPQGAFVAATRFDDISAIDGFASALLL